MRFDLYRHPDDEQEAWRSLWMEQQQRQQTQQSVTAPQASRIAEIHKQYPWLALPVKLALARADAPDPLVEYAAYLDARSKSE